jgi:hypothetical protein
MNEEGKIRRRLGRKIRLEGKRSVEGRGEEGEDWDGKERRRREDWEEEGEDWERKE